MTTQALQQAKEALKDLVDVIEAAGLLNLSNGVQLGSTVWYVKASDAMEFAKEVLATVDASPSPVSAQPIGEQGLDAATAKIIQMSASLGLETLLPKAREIIRALPSQPAQPISTEAQEQVSSLGGHCSGFTNEFGQRVYVAAQTVGGRRMTVGMDRDDDTVFSATVSDLEGMGLLRALRSLFCASLAPDVRPIDMILHCPKCGEQHIDAPDERTPNWKNEPHRSHLCHGCGHIWRPADVPTNGVAAIKTKGKADSAAPDVRPSEQLLTLKEMDDLRFAWDRLHALREDHACQVLMPILNKLEPVSKDVRPSAPAQDSEGTSEFDKGFLAGLAAATGDTSVSVPVSDKQIKPRDGWAVHVEVDGERILSIESECLSGVHDIDRYADTVRNCAQHLLSFIGNGEPSEFFPPDDAPVASQPAAPQQEPALDSIEYDPSGKLASADVTVSGERVTLVRQAAPQRCSNCDGKGGFVLGNWPGQASGPEQHSERCDVCEGSGKEPAQAAQAAQPTPAVPEGWNRITRTGQVKVGDKLRFTIGSEKYSETVKQILSPATAQEEIIYNKRQNYYLITSMAIENKGSQKNVEFMSAAAPSVSADAKESERDRTIRQAVVYHDGHWPQELYSGVMFFKGERITENQFKNAIAAQSKEPKGAGE